MDRFIETETYASQLMRSCLKSNMDRFIAADANAKNLEFFV